MISMRPASERGLGSHGWLESRHTFSFADYYDPNHSGFGVLRVINEDRVAPGRGFGMHPHRDMEIVSYILEGSLEHQDSMGHGGVLKPGEVQRITAGTGILHSEKNPSPSEPVHFYQIWLLPDRAGHSPSYAQKAFAASERQGRWQTIVSPDGRQGSITIKQNASIALAELQAGKPLAYSFQAGRHGWLQVLRGHLTMGEESLAPGDGVAMLDEQTVTLSPATQAAVMLFDLP